MILQVNETLDGVGKLADRQGQIFALFALFMVGAGIFIYWLVRYFMREVKEAREQYASDVKEQNQLHATEAKEARQDFARIADAISTSAEARSKEQIAAINDLHNTLRQGNGRTRR